MILHGEGAREWTWSLSRYMDEINWGRNHLYLFSLKHEENFRHKNITKRVYTGWRSSQSSNGSIPRQVLQNDGVLSALSDFKYKILNF